MTETAPSAPASGAAVPDDVVVLCGGFGAARFLDGLRAVVPAPTCVVNTGDDLDYLGLHVSPDVDTVLYALAGCFDEERGWGVQGDTFRCNEALARYGEDWFHVGDADLALHMKRSAYLRAGLTLSEAMVRIVEAWDLPARVLPMTDDPVRTMVDTDEGVLGFQQYVVARGAAPRVRAVEYAGADSAHPAPGVLEALAGAEVAIVAPSNPVSSIGPILALPGVGETLRRRRGVTVAVTPVVGTPPRTAAERGRGRVRELLMGACGLPHRPHAVVQRYGGLIDGFVLDHRDADERAAIEAAGVPLVEADTLAGAAADRAALARTVLEFASALRPARERVTSGR